MANQSFSGAVANQYYRWGYTCELCGKEVEKRDGFSTRVGSTHKSTSWVYTTRANAEAMKEQAKMQLAVAVAQMDEKIKAGGFEIPKNENGKCPHCKQYQHWSPHIKSYSKSLKMTEKEKKKDNVGTGCLTTFIGAWIGLFTGLGLLAIVAKPGMEKGPTIAAFAGGFLLGELITWVAARVIIRKGNEKDAARMKALEDVEKKEPYFIAWAEQNSDIIGMSLH